MWLPYYPYGVMVLSVGYAATVQDAAAWRTTNNLTYTTLSDYPGTPSGVTLQYTNFLGNAVLPWDAIVTVDRILAYTEATYTPEGQWLIGDVEEVFDSLFDPQAQADPAQLDFGLVTYGSVVQRTLVLDNAGTGLLDIQNITSSSPYFTPDITQGQVYAVDDSLEITVTLDAQAVGNFNETLTIFATQDTLTVPMLAEVPEAVGPDPARPQSFAVACFPNPFNASAAINFELRAASFVSLKVYDTADRLVAILVDGWREAGSHEAIFDASKLASGIYLYILEAGEQTATGKMVLMR